MIQQEVIKKGELGQVWTPSDVACEMAKEVLAVNPRAKHVLDPACGPATFSTAFDSAGAKNIDLVCYDVDETMKKFTAKTNRKLGFKSKTRLADYLADTSLEGTFDTIIMNPPYIRQEDIAKVNKDKYHQYLSQNFREKIDKRTNLFALFLLKGTLDLKPNGVMCAIVYDAISQTEYGKKTLKLMDRHAKMLSSKHVKMPFDDVLVDAQILLFRKRQHILEASESYKERCDDKLTTLEKLLDTRRGTCFPLRKLFIATRNDPYFSSTSPLFIKQRNITGLVVKPDQRAYLANKPLRAEIFKWLHKRSDNQFPLSKMAVRGIKGPIVFNYYMRKAPRHLWNPKNIAVTDNFYVSTPRNDFPSEIAWFLLNSDLYISKLLRAARNQGNGLLKLQLFEYKNVRMPDWNRIPKREIAALSKVAKELIKDNASYETIRKIADKATKGLFNA
ncbi:MAG: N-6 DNA methylase [Omnitrophica bacterium]|nr:N-6 DNA methylase [Candidatus Omnitrophota bacterium]